MASRKHFFPDAVYLSDVAPDGLSSAREYYEKRETPRTTECNVPHNNRVFINIRSVVAYHLIQDEYPRK